MRNSGSNQPQSLAPRWPCQTPVGDGVPCDDGGKTSCVHADRGGSRRYVLVLNGSAAVATRWYVPGVIPGENWAKRFRDVGVPRNRAEDIPDGERVRRRVVQRRRAWRGTMAVVCVRPSRSLVLGWKPDEQRGWHIDTFRFRQSTYPRDRQERSCSRAY
ncbi:hypothetical protein BJV74DRAFT_453242 [Russula compacta]|nr:hypothetical protein BJV74DRAFT_453242 [Russula compacta]